MQTHNSATILYELQQILIQIKNSSELSDIEQRQLANDLSKHGLNLLHYALFAMENNQLKLDFTSVSAAAALYDVTQDIKPLASNYNIEMHFNASPNLEPVYTNEQYLKGSIYGLLAGIITGNNHNRDTVKLTVTVQQTKPFIQRIGVYSDSALITTKLVRPVKTTRVTRMTRPEITHTSGLGFTVSQLLTERLQAHFEPFCHKNNKGIGFYLAESKQLSLIN
ncbi:MAG: hypothetical protein MUF85_02485 [Patescibacteria group bacterium]|nr:hypothetical protein [Patescibacteria group bacterium]